MGPSNCGFYEWSWEAFIWATAIDTNTHQARFLGFKTPNDLLPNPRATKPGVLALKLRKLKPRHGGRTFDSLDQAGSEGVLVAQDGQPVFYSVHMNPAYFQTAKKYYGVAQFNGAPATQNFPNGAAVFKASWRVLSQPGPTQYYITRAAVPILITSTNSQGAQTVSPDPSGRSREVTVGLIGLHVVGVTANHPEFIWATFEHNDNAPDLPANVATNSPLAVSTQSFTFYRAGTSAQTCNLLSTNEHIVSAPRQSVGPVVSAFRQFSHGGDSLRGAAQIDKLNAASTQEIAAYAQTHPAYASEAVWSNYRLIGAAWQSPNSLAPGLTNMDATIIGGTNLANATMETYVQGPQNNAGQNANCFMCHNTAADAQVGMPAKNLGLSHVLDAPFFSN